MFERVKFAHAYDSLEPHIDAKTMEVHSEKHHEGYTTKLNDAVKMVDKLEGKTIEDILRNLDSIPEEFRTAIRNNGGGFYNHNHFFSILSPDGGGEPSGELAEEIEKIFGSFNSFKEEFTKVATGVFGSGWAWLAADENGEKLHIHAHPLQDNPLMHNHKPILGLDVWEHAYYLNYQNKRPDYIEAWWNVIDWEKVGEIYGDAIK